MNASNSFESRIPGLHRPQRDRKKRLGKARTLLLFLPIIALGIGIAGFRLNVISQASDVIAGNEIGADTEKLIKRIGERTEYCFNPPAAVKTLQYECVVRDRTVSVKTERDDAHRIDAWQGVALSGGLHELIRSPEHFDVRQESDEAAKTITLHAILNKDFQDFDFLAGTRIENTWYGCFSYPVRKTTVTVDAKRLVPLREETRETTIVYRDWREVERDRWVPKRIDVIRFQDHYCFHFDWLDRKLWLLRFSEMFAADANATIAEIRNVRINGEQVDQPPSSARVQSQAAISAMNSLLDHNRPWLDRGPDGIGWKPPFETLSYSFHTLRDDVVESCVVDRGGESVIEVVHAAKDELQYGPGSRRVALNSQEYATATRGDTFAKIEPRPARPEGCPMDLALKHYARIGCQFDLPLFRYRERIELAQAEIADGEWQGTPCRKVTVNGIGGNFVLGCGTMFGFTSWSYMHHVGPTKEVFYIDPARNVLLHETLTSGNRVFEIDFGDYVEPAHAQFAPRSIRIDCAGEFTCEYRFQLVGGTHWLLQEVTSWFKPEDKSRGVVENVRINGDRSLLDDARRQVAASRKLAAGEGEPSDQVDLAIVPFAVGEVRRVGSYDVHVTMKEPRIVTIEVETADPAAPSPVPVCFLDEQRRLLISPSIELAERNGKRRGQAKIHASRIWANVKSVAAPGPAAAGANSIPVKVVPFRWNEALAVNIPDSNQGNRDWSGREWRPLPARTRGFQVQVDRQPDGTSRARLNVFSTDGPREFLFDVSLALVSRSGELMASGHLATGLRVEWKPVQEQYEIELAAIPEGKEPASLVIGISPGDVVSAPHGSFWGMFFRQAVPFPIDAMLSSSDENCRMLGLKELGDHDADSSIFKEFHDEDPAPVDGPRSRLAKLKPHRESLRRIVRDSQRPDVLASAIRYLAYSEDDSAKTVLEPLVTHEEPEVHEAATIGLTFLKRDAYLDVLQSILERRLLPRHRRAELTTEVDARIALLHLGTDGAIDLLGETLLSDLRDFKLESDPKRGEATVWHTERAQDICRSLGNSGRPRAAHWLLSALELIAERPELSEHFNQDRLMASLLRFEPEASGRIAAGIESGENSSAWMSAIRRSRNPAYVGAVQALLKQDLLGDDGITECVDYLSRVGTPEAITVLKDCYTKYIGRQDPQLRMSLCRALAKAGDVTGLPLAFEELVRMHQDAAAPQDDREYGNWKAIRDRRQTQAIQVLTSAPMEILRDFLRERIATTSPEEQRVVLDLLWTLPNVPAEFFPEVRKWARSDDGPIARSAKLLLARE